ncbi:type II toxin-antitoxin system HicA family toxin [Oryzomonas japonica]|uniref:Type II toxin-antitoxin system HicA family toxin n=1 Tax=Oryzomonas japonica TaxID=2603858 RepID=A0A7J4ZR44_9BACT|nr:type II toxin-antitoxin system HicA family toxin [Oryzomonas japonica]
MTTADKTLERMRNNPRDWRIGDLISVAERYGVEVRNNGGSHHVFSTRGIAESLCVPAHRPIKPVYVKNLVSMIDAIRENTP